MYQESQIDERTKKRLTENGDPKNEDPFSSKTPITQTLTSCFCGKTMRPCSLRALRQRFRKGNVSEPNPNPSWKRHLQLKYFWILRTLPIGRFYWTPAHSFPMTELQLRWENHLEIHTVVLFSIQKLISLLDLFSLYRERHWLSLEKRRNAFHWSIAFLDSWGRSRPPNRLC